MHSSEPSAPRSSMTLLMADDDEDDRALFWFIAQLAEVAMAEASARSTA